MMKMTKSILTVLVVFLCGITINAQELPDSSRIIRVLTFNILHGATTRGDYDLDLIARKISDANPDLVALQEVDFRTVRAMGYDLATELGWRTKMAPLFGRAMYYSGGEYGDAILSKYSFLKTRNVPLPFTPGNEPRTALQVVIVIPSGDTIAFVGTHLDHLHAENDRIAQVTKINEEFARGSYPVILAGDLNAQPESNPVRILEEMWSSAKDAGTTDPTFPSDDPQVKIDYVMYHPVNQWKTLETRVICDSIASDHCAFLVTLELLKK
jgi:endonuclease/exonuclease/phosphatase family metal-dependent hydrolase